MSELIQKNDDRSTIRWKLLTGASALALTAYVSSTALATAEESSRPQVWIELGAQIERASGGDNAYSPLFFNNLDPSLPSPAAVEKELPWSLGPEAKISLQPDGSNWVFSAGIRYGRASNHRHTQQQTRPGTQTNRFPYTNTAGVRVCCHTYHYPSVLANFVDNRSSHRESHLILDFQAGKDVGLGLFGRDSSSVVSAGVRFAQLNSSMEDFVQARADFQRYNGASAKQQMKFPNVYILFSNFNTYALNATSARAFHGVGPSISWEASAALAGNPDTSELTFDWGINGAVLFGKQKAKTRHQSSGNHHSEFGYYSLYKHPLTGQTRTRSVTVPNAGGMAGFSIKWPNAKISIGYRADYFFGAMDGGWDTRKSQTRSFMGPFASISVGLGD